MWIVSLPRNFPDFPLTSHWYIIYYYYPIHKSGITITYYITETTPWHHYTPSGWWYTYPSEKYGSQIGSSSQLLGNIKVMFQTTNQVCTYIYIYMYIVYIYTPLYGIHDIIFIIHHSLTFIYTTSCYSLTFHEQSITYHFLPVGIHNTPKVTMKNTIHEPCHKVVPQFGIAKLVPITPITLWFMLDISNYVLWLSMVIYL